MLSKAIAYLENRPAIIMQVRLRKRGENYVYSIEAKTERGRVETFQLRGRTLYHHIFHIGNQTEEKILYQFSEQ
jgi:hypothetical protein